MYSLAISKKETCRRYKLDMVNAPRAVQVVEYQPIEKMKASHPAGDTTESKTTFFKRQSQREGLTIIIMADGPVHQIFCALV